VALVAVVLTAVPVWQASRAAESGAFREAGRGIVGGSARAQKMLIGVQVAFTLALVAVGGVFALSFRNLATVPLGLRIDAAAQAPLQPLPGGYRVPDPAAYYTNLLARVAASPGVRAASLTSFPIFWFRFQPELVRASDGTAETRAQIIRTTHGYFRSIGVDLVAGEDFRTDPTESQAIVSQSVASSLGAPTLGRQIVIGEGAAARRWRIVAVAPTMTISMADIRETRAPIVYLNFWQDRAQQRYPTLIVQGAGRAPDARAISQAVGGLGVEYVQEYLPLETAHGMSIVEDRLMAYLGAAFAGLALALAAIGLFAILSCYVSRRTGEFGVRIALGANAWHLRTLVLRQIGVVLGAGIAAGLGLSIAVGKVLAGMTFGVPARSPALMAAAVALILAAALVAAWIPGRRATSIQPVEALRRE
ncbi:MAG TPA: FtsX-like permease family protein, partial [Gemmataceae bacterium]|nr:FtsX-like permease family protein [Gemmataceae bacterium]